MNEYYNSLKEDQNNMSFWLPRVQKRKSFDTTFKIPKTAIIPVPPEIMELFFMEKKGMTQNEIMVKVMEWVRDEFIPKAEAQIGGGLWFVKNGTFSNKFTFSGCRNISSNILYLTANIIDINYTSFMYDAGGNTELVAREFIPPFENVPSIYHGMPLRPEVRVFYDFNHREVLYAKNYWDWDYCYDAISRDPTDKIVYEAYYENIKKSYCDVEYDVINKAKAGLIDVDLEGIWSVDFLVQGEDCWLIDMARGQQSAYWDPNLVRKIYEEHGWEIK